MTDPEHDQRPEPRHHYRVQQDIRQDIREVEELYRTGVIQNDWPREMFWPVVTRLVIAIRDLLAKCEKHGDKPIDFTDDVIVRGRVKDAASLIRFMRDALCHVDLPHHMKDETNYLSFSSVRGKGAGIDWMGEKIGSDYPDDIAFIFGNQRVYFKRHLVRAFNEAVMNLQAFLKQDFTNRA